MKKYKITIKTDTPDWNGEATQSWYAYDEQQAIAQCFLSHAYAGARCLQVISIEELQA